MQQGPAKQRGSHLLHGLVSRDTRFTCHCCDGQNLPGATIGFLLARFKWGFLCLTNHIVILRLEKNRLELEQEPLFGGTKRFPVLALQQNTSPNNLIKPVWELGLEGATDDRG